MTGLRESGLVWAIYESNHNGNLMLEPPRMRLGQARPSKRPNGQRAAPHTGAGLQVVKVKLPARVACKSMNHAHKYLAQANRQIAELAVQIARQRVIVKRALDTGQRSEMADSLLDALEGSLRIFEKHRIFLLSLQRQPSE